MDAEGPPDPGDPDQAGHEVGQLVHQLGELVDDQHQPGQAHGAGLFRVVLPGGY